VFCGWGLINVILDYRSLGFFCFFVATVVWVKTGKHSTVQISKFVLPVCLSLLMLIVAYLGTQQSYADRRLASNEGRFAAYEVALKAISQSPLVGYGSWATNKEFSELYLNLTGGNRSFASSERLAAQAVIPSHSQILQSWVEGGILGTAFFAFLGYKLVMSIAFIVFERQYDSLLPLFLFNLLVSTWNLFASPFGGNHRIPIAIAVATICVLSYEKSHKLRTRRPLNAS
jgi:O-antigen ligase